MHRHPSWQPEHWRDLDAWRYGVDLFNRFYFWEAHEAWEGLWASTPRDGVPSVFLQGLIQIAAALLKVHQGMVVGVRTLSQGGLEKLRRVAATDPEMMGLNVRQSVQDFEHYFRNAESAGGPGLGPSVPALVLATGTNSRASQDGCLG